MKIIIKDIEFIIKKIFFSQSYLLKKRLIRAINKNYEKELEIIDKFRDKNKDAIDIGVYRGLYSYKLAQNYKLVHAFEPNPLLYPYLDRNLNKIIKNISLYNFALSNVSGETKLKLPLRSQSIFQDNIEELYQLGASSIHPKNQLSKYKEVIVQMKKLDNFEISNNIGFIKIDVEGHELEVIDGAINTITKNMPVLLIEIEERHTQKSVLDSISYIKNIGYDCFFVKNRELVSIDNLSDTKFENNYYFIPKN